MLDTHTLCSIVPCLQIAYSQLGGNLQVAYASTDHAILSSLQLKRDRTRSRTKQYFVCKGFAHAYLLPVSMLWLVWYFFRHELRFTAFVAYATWYAQYHVNALSSGTCQLGVLYSETALQVLLLNRLSYLCFAFTVGIILFKALQLFKNTCNR